MAEEKKLRVLVVEDEGEIIEIYKSVFANERRIEARFSQDGSQAAALMRSETYDVAILDIKLPNMNGLQVAAVARSSNLNRRIPIFVVSNLIDDQARARASSLGNVKMIDKPFAPDQIVKMIIEATAGQKKVSGYDARILNAILKSSSEVLEFYHGEAVQIGKPGVRKSPQTKRAGVTGLIGIAGETFAGSLAIVSGHPFIQKLATKIFQNDQVKLDQEMVADLMGETCNQVCGRLKTAFSDLGIKSNIGLPEVVIGNDHVVIHKVHNPVLFVPLQVAGTTCEVEFCLAERSGFDIDESKREQTVTGVLMFD